MFVYSTRWNRSTDWFIGLGKLRPMEELAKLRELISHRVKSFGYQAMQELAQDASSLFAVDVHIGELGCIERQMDTKVRPFLVANSELFLLEP